MDEIKIIREKTKEITKSKETALKYLKDSGILDFVKRNERKNTSSKNDTC